MATKTCLRKTAPRVLAAPRVKLGTVREQTATKTIRRTTAKNTKNTHGVNQARVYVQNIPANAIRREYNIYRRTRANARNQSIRKSQRCISNTLQRRQCKKRTAHTPKCWIHLAKEDNLRIKPSNIRNAGKGLFAWKTRIPANKFIAKYTGRNTTRQELDRKYGQGLAEYAMCDNQGNCVDANYTTDDAARFANDHRGTIYRENAHYKGRHRRFYLKSARSIPAHHEIFASYDNEYWNRGRK